MLLHIVPWQLDTYGETLHDQDNAGELQCDLVGIAPGTRINEICGVRAEDDSTKGCYGRFSNVQAFLDDGRTQHEQGGKATEDDVHQMWLIDR